MSNWKRYTVLLSAAVTLLFSAAPSLATCPTFHQLQDGQTARAGDVMDNFSHVMNCPGLQLYSHFSTWIRDGLFESAAVPVVLNTPGAGRIFLGYQDDAGGQYNGAIGFGTAAPLGTNQVPYQNSIHASTNGALVFRTGIAGANPNTERMRIDASGNVGIGTTSPTYTLHVNGTAYATGAAGALSDVRDKKSIAPLSMSALDIIVKLRPVTFFWKMPKDEGMNGQQTGLIAQEVEKVLPSTILTAKDTRKSKAIKYDELIVVLIKAAQEQRAAMLEQRREITTLQAENAKLREEHSVVERQAGQITDLRARLDRLERKFLAKNNAADGWLVR